jgi:hypothetical protein
MQEEKKYNRKINRKARGMGRPRAGEGSPSSPGFGRELLGWKQGRCMLNIPPQAERRPRMNAVLWGSHLRF